MSSADRRERIGTSAYWLHGWPRQYGFALMIVAAATLLRYALAVLIGSNLLFILFYPAILLVAWMAGLWPGVLAVFLSAASASYLFFRPISPAVGLPHNANGLTLFTIAGLAICGLADTYRRRSRRLLEFEKAVEGLEEMIVVVDRDARYVIANRAFLSYRGMEREQVIGRRVSEILNLGVFETTVKDKLNECFQGKIVQYEMRYTYPSRGERNLLISCFPIEGPGGVDRVACVLQDITERKQAEHSLKLFRTLIDHSNDAVEVIDPETLRFLDVNEKACNDLGYTREELLSLTVDDIDPNADQSCHAAVIEKLCSSGFAVKETVHRRKDGSIFPVETSLKLVELDRSYIVAVTRDISERKHAEEALRESEDRYRDLVEHSKDLVCIHDLEGNLMSVNPAPARILGYETAELLKVPMRELVAPDFRQQFDEYLMRIRATGADKGLLCVLTRSGERRIWEYSNTLRTEGVASPIVRGMARDVTEQKRAEAALRSSEQRYRLLFEKNIAGVAICTQDGRVLDCNEAWARMLGYDSADEIRGHHATEFYFNPADRELMRQELEQKGTIRGREMQLRQKDGTAVWILFDSAVREAGTGQPLIQATAINITNRKQALEALRRREEDYRTFVAQSSEGIFREDLDSPVSVDLPEDELIYHILHDSYLAECNDAMAKMYGHDSAQGLLGKRLTEMLVVDDPHNIELTREYIRCGFRVLECESHEVDIHGSPKTFRNSIIGIIEDGKLVRTWGIQRDVTEQVKLDDARKEAEAALRKSEEHFRILVEQASDGIFLADSEGRYLDANTAGAEMLGYRRDEIVRLSLADVLASEELPRLAPEIARFDGGEVIQSEWKFRRKDGSIFSGEVCGKRLPDGRLQGILRDITERKNAEEGMRQSEERFRVALKDSPITVFNQDRDLRYTWIYNPRVYWQTEILGKTDEEILGGKGASRLTEIKQRVLHTGATVREEVSITHDEMTYALDMTIEPLFDSGHRVVGITGAAMDIARLRQLADRLQEDKDKLAREKLYLEKEIETELGFEKIVGHSSSLRQVLNKVRVVAPTDSTVLLLGDTGTGKELVARSVHTLSLRNERNFVKLNCAAVPSGLLESELFGHEKGAFTGAVSQKVGRIELADKGTLFLDEIGDLPLELQPKLLRVLQDREFERLGGIRTLHVDVRIIAATNRDLRKDIADKTFREDLFYRLNVFPIRLPALRERRSDIPILIRHFVSKYAARMGKHINVIPDETIEVLQNWNWPGNVRELENVIERMVIFSKGNVLAPAPAELETPQDVEGDSLRDMEREHILRVLRETHGALSGADGAADRLGMKRTTLQSKMKRLGIGHHDYRNGKSLH